MTTGQRSKAVRDVVKESEGFGTLTGRLEAAERILSWRISTIDEKGENAVLPDPLLAADIGLTTEEYEWLLGLLGEALRSVAGYPQAMEKLIDDFPLVLIASLTGSAMLNTSDGFWEDFRRRLRIDEISPLEALVRSRLHRLLKRKKLTTFESADLSGRDYVGTIELHAIIPNRYLGNLLRFLDDAESRGTSFPTAEAFGDYAVGEFSVRGNELGAPPALQSLATHIPDRSTDVFARIHEIHSYYRAPSAEPLDPAEGTNGLPEPMFSHLTRLLTVGEEEAADPAEPLHDPVELEDPYLFLDLDVLELYLVFPGIPPGYFDEAHPPTWTVNLDDELVSVSPEFDWSSGGFQERRIRLDKPFSRLSATRPDGSELDFGNVFGKDNPVLFLREDGRVRANQTTLGRQDFLAITPSATVIAAHTVANTPFVYQELGPVSGWPDWVVRAIPARHLRTLTVKHRAERRDYAADRKVDAQWHDKGAVIKHLKGLDLQPVFCRSPRLTIPSDEAIWTLEYWHLAADNQRHSMGSYEVEDRDEPFEVFDELDDPWVGRYEVVVRRGGKVHLRRIFNMAEGLQIKLTFERSTERGRFRVPDAKGRAPGLSKTWVEFHSESEARLRLPNGSQKLGSQHRTRRFTIKSARNSDDYCLDVVVDAPRLQYLLPLRDEASRWADIPQTINFDDLTDNDEIQLKFPQSVMGVTLGLHSLARGGRPRAEETITLSRKGSSNVWFCPVSRLKSAMTRDAEFQILASWYLMSLEDHVQSALNTYDRKRWYKTPEKERQDPRSRATAFLFSVSKKPLVASGEIVEEQLTLNLGRASDLPLATWSWQLHAPTAPPVRIEMTGTSGVLPPELHGGGPLIVDTREEAFLMFWEPKIPSSHAILVDQPGLAPTLDPMNKHRWLFARDRDLLPGEVQTVWETRDRLHNVLARSENREHPTLARFDRATLDYLVSDPRISLTELDNSGIPQDRQLEAFIRSGLVTSKFSHAVTAGDIHPNPWIGLIQEMNDLRTLRLWRTGDHSVAAERAESEHYVREVGGRELWKILTGATKGIPVVKKHALNPAEVVFVRAQGPELLREQLGVSAVGAAFISSDSRLAAQLDWLEKRREFTDNPRIEELFKVVQYWENLIDHLNDEKLKKTARSLAFVPEEQWSNAGDNWLFVPYISFVSSLLARSVAHGVIRPIAPLHETRHVWASIARLVPGLTSFDLVVAEATVLHSTSQL